MAQHEQKDDAVLAIPVSVFERLIEKIDQLGAAGGSLTADGLRDVLKANSAEHAEAMGRMLIPENKIIPQVSVFSYPEGETARPKPRLMDSRGKARETVFCQGRQSEDQLTPAEIIAFNAIQTNCEARNGLWKATIRREGEREYLFIDVPARDADDRMELPSLLAILKELAEGPQAVDLAVLSSELKSLRERVAAAEALAK